MGDMKSDLQGLWDNVALWYGALEVACAHKPSHKWPLEDKNKTEPELCQPKSCDSATAELGNGACLKNIPSQC